MKIIRAEFIHNKKKDHHADGNAYSQPQYIDERKNFTLHQIPPGGYKIVSKHLRFDI